MKYQRVLYTKKFTTELKSKLRILSYDKRRSLKGNVYYVSFASDTDIEYADRISKHLRNVTLKPFKPRCATEAQCDNRIIRCSHHDSLASSLITSEPDLSRQNKEIREECAMCILSPQDTIRQNGAPTSILQTSNVDKQQLIDDVQSCLSTMETVRLTADELCQLYKRGVDCRSALNHLFKIHSTAFYLKVATSAQIKAGFLAGIRLSWSDIANIITVLKADVRHEQSFMVQVSSAKYISSKIDSATSITMSSKLAYQLAKLSD